MKNKVNIGYLTALAIMITTSCTGILHADTDTEYARPFTNNTTNPITVKITYRKSSHKSNETSTTTIAAGATANAISWDQPMGMEITSGQYKIKRPCCHNTCENGPNNKETYATTYSVNMNATNDGLAVTGICPTGYTFSNFTA